MMACHAAGDRASRVGCPGPGPGPSRYGHDAADGPGSCVRVTGASVGPGLAAGAAGTVTVTFARRGGLSTLNADSDPGRGTGPARCQHAAATLSRSPGPGSADRDILIITGAGPARTRITIDPYQ